MSMKYARLTLPAAALLFASHAFAQSRDMGGGRCSANVYNCADTPNPLPPTNSVWLEDMTWMDVRDAIKAGKTTVIISTGGMEPNGPWLVTGKHNYVLRTNCEAIARKLGNALCAPIIKLVPEGNIEPPSSHMVSPNTISMRENTFRAMLTDVVVSLKQHGFTRIILIGDSGGNQGGQRWVADSLTRIWNGNPIVAHIQEYYDYAGVGRYMATRGITEGQSDNLHDDPEITLNMFITDPASVRWEQRVKAGKATINGFSIADRVKTLELARTLVEYRATSTADAIAKATANKGTLAAAGRGRGNVAFAGGDSAAGGGGRGRGRGRGGDSAAAAGGGGGGGGGGGRAQQAGEAVAPAMRNMGGGNCSANPYNCAGVKNPVPEAPSIWMEELTWMGVRDALAAGKKTIIVPTGGMEPNGPWLVLGKHNYVLKANCEAIARKLGNALCAPVIELVPEGNIDPPSIHMFSPGTISLRESTFRDMLTDVAHSFKMHGFTNIILIGDSGGNQPGMQAVADSLTAAWKGSGAKVVHVPEYYYEFYQPKAGAPNVLRDLGIAKANQPVDSLHDDALITLQMMVADPASVRWAERVKTRQATINGVSIADLPKALEWGRKLVDARATRTVAVIKQRTAR